MEEIVRSPWGFAMNRNEDRAMAANSVIIHDDKNAETLLTLENILCMLGIQFSGEILEEERKL